VYLAMRLTKLPEVNMGQWFKLCSQLNKSSTQISGSSAQWKDPEFGPVIEGPTSSYSFLALSIPLPQWSVPRKLKD